MRLASIFALVILAQLSYAQAKITFDKDTHDFGEIEEAAGYAEHTFYFVNEGDRPVTVTRVKASCGCTTPGWSREQIMPGDSGFVQARYNPQNRPGKFRKSLRLTTDEVSQNKALYITGFVKPKPKSVEEELPITVDDLRIKYRSLNLGRITTEKTISKSFDVYNSGEGPVRLNHGIMEVPNHIKLNLEPKVLAPGAKGQLIINYDPIKKDDLGFISDNVTLQTDSVLKIKNEFYVIATIEEFFPDMTAEELAGAPKLNIENRVYDFGKVNAGELITTEFELVNAGKETLNFRKVKSNCSCVTYELKSSTIKKGKAQALKVVFDTTDRRGNQYKTVAIFSNDPMAPTQMVTVKGIVKKVEEDQ